MKDIFNIKKILESKSTITILGLMLAVGFILIMFSKTPNSENTNKKTNHEEQENIKNVTQNIQLNDNMEVKLKKILSSIKNVGNVEILINYKTTSEKIVLKGNEGGQNEKTVIVDDNGSSIPFIKQERNGEIEGVIIVADGADRIDVQVDVTEAVSALLNIPVHKIKVFKMKG